MARSKRPTSPYILPVNTLRRQTRWIPKRNRITPRTVKTIIATFTKIVLSIGNLHPSRRQNHQGLPLQPNRTIVLYSDTHHFILKMISTSTEKEEKLKVERLVKKSAAALLLESSIGRRFDANRYGHLRKRNLGSPIPPAGGREADTRV